MIRVCKRHFWSVWGIAASVEYGCVDDLVVQCNFGGYLFFSFSLALSPLFTISMKRKKNKHWKCECMIDSRTVTLHRYFFIFIINIIIIIIISLFLSLPLQRKLVIRYMQLNLQQVAVTRRKSLCVASNYWYFTLLSLEHLLTLFFFVL